MFFSFKKDHAFVDRAFAIEFAYELGPNWFLVVINMLVSIIWICAFLRSMEDDLNSVNFMAFKVIILYIFII